MITLTRTLFVVAAILLLNIGQASAVLVVPTGIETFHRGDSNSPGNGSNWKVLDGSGMTKPDAADPATWTVSNTAWANDWQGFSTPNGTNRTWAVLDLGAATPDLDTMYLWNVQETNALTRGMNAFDIYYATNPSVAPPATSGSVTNYDFGSGGWTLLSSETIAQGTQNGDSGQTYDVSGAAGAQFIGFKMNSNHGGNRVGFAEVAFTTEPSSDSGVPEPATAALALMGMAGLAIRRRRTA